MRIILLLGILSLFVLAACTPQSAEVEAKDVATTNAPSVDMTIVLTGENFKFVQDGVDNPDINVQVGQRIRVEFTSTSGMHDWVVDGMDVATERVRDGETTSVEFTVREAGTFEYYCSVGSHRLQGMKGNLIVN